MNEVVLQLERIYKVLNVFCLQRVIGIKVICLEIVDLSDFSIELLQLFMVFFELHGVKWLQLLQSFSQKRLLHEFLVDSSIFLLFK